MEELRFPSDEAQKQFWLLPGNSQVVTVWTDPAFAKADLDAGRADLAIFNGMGWEMRRLHDKYADYRQEARALSKRLHPQLDRRSAA